LTCFLTGLEESWGRYSNGQFNQTFIRVKGRMKTEKRRQGKTVSQQQGEKAPALFASWYWGFSENLN